MDNLVPRNNRHTSLPIGWFVAFSLLLHVLLFWSMIDHQTNVPSPAPQQAKGGLHISLMPYHVRTQLPKAEPRETKPISQQVQKTIPPASAEPASMHQMENSRVADASFRERIMVKLRGALAAHFIYPMLARQRNWQGEVLLAFRLEQDGRISDAHITRSSGYSLLDQAALNALGRVGTLGEILPRSLTLELPVIYRLES